MKRAVLVFLFVLALLSLPAAAQTQPAPNDPNTGGVWQVITDTNNIAPAAFLLSNIADAKTDWHFTGFITHKEYTITPAQRLGIAGGGMFVAFALRHYFPKTVKPINIALGVATAYFAGRAYGNTFKHGSEAVTPASPPSATAALAFSYQFQLKR